MSELAERIAALSPKKRELLLRQLGVADPRLRESPIRAVSRTAGRFPLSSAQRRIWFLEQMEPGNPASNLHGGMFLDGALNVAALSASLNELVRRHESLRTIFVAQDGEPAQIVIASLRLTLPVLDLCELPGKLCDREVLRLTRQETARGFDLARGPQLRTTLVRLEPDRHLLVLVMHHVVSDAWSMGMFFNELQVLYGLFSGQQQSRLPEPQLQYIDFAVWQNTWLQSDAVQRQMAYWRQRLQGAPQVLELPTDKKRPARSSQRGATVSLVISKETTQALKRLGQSHGATLFMTLVAIFKVLLLKYTGQEDLVIGTPIAGRNRSELEKIFGFFINTLVLRTDVAGDPLFAQLLRTMAQGTLEAYDNQDLPFERLVEELQPERRLNRQPLFQVMFQLQNAPFVSPQLHGLRVSPLRTENAATQFDLTFSFTEAEGALFGLLQYSVDLFEDSTARRITQHFHVLAEEVVKTPEKRISELCLLSACERQQVLFEWNSTRTAYPRDRCVHHMFEAQVERNGKQSAVVSDTGELTYAELNERSNRLAHYLRSQGIGPEGIVGVLMGRSLEMVISILAVLKAGGAYLPLDPDYPPQRMRSMVENSGLKVVLTDSHHCGLMDSEGIQQVLLDRPAFMFSESIQNPVTGVSPENLAYVIYTSGSTGQPKGVAIQHQGLVNLVSWHMQTYQVTASDRMTNLAGLSFDASVWELWSCLAAGATLRLVEEEVRTDPAKLGALYATQNITLSFLPTSLAESLFDEEIGANLTCLRTLLVGGDRLASPPKYLLPFALVNHYGPTESSVVATSAKITCGAQGSPPIGRPIANTNTYILDKYCRPVAIGVTGELYIGGEGLARGYLNEAAKTADRFVPDACSGVAGSRLYRTGDLARYLPDGNIEFAGRTDHQVKIRGFRIELGEIESTLKRHPSVRQAVVVVSEKESHRQKYLVAYVVLNDQAPPAPAELEAFLRNALPGYMVPVFFVILEKLALTPNGKLDRRGLPDPQGPGSAVEDAIVSASTPTEDVVHAIWAELLGLERVGRHENFFALGGHSLLATQVVSRLRSAFGVELDIRTLFEKPTITGLAEEVVSSRHTVSIAPPIMPAERQRAGDPLSFAQRRLWFLDQFVSDKSTYNLPAVLHLTGNVDVCMLGRCFDEIARRHEILRTTFTEHQGEPVQVVHPAHEVSVAQIDLSDLPEDRRRKTALKLAGREMRQPFDLAHGPLLRITALRLRAEDHLLVVNMHHIVSDGWSTGILVRELAELYRAFSANRLPALTELPVQYCDYARWQRAWIDGEVLQTQLAYWKNRLKDIPVLELPTDRPRPAVQTFRGAQRSRALSASMDRALVQFSRKESVTPFMAIQAIFALLLRRYTGQQEIVIGSPIANRSRREIEPLIGFFVNTMIFVVNLSGSPSFRDVLRRVRNDTLDAYAHQDLPFEKLVEEIHGPRDLSANPLFQVMLAMQNAPMPALELPGVAVEPVEIQTGSAKFDLLLSVIDSAAGALFILEFKTDLFDSSTAERMLGHMSVLLEAALEQPDKMIDDLEVLTAAERQQLLLEWNDTSANGQQRAGCIQEIFETQVQNRPGAAAIEFCGVLFTYDKLNRLANRLAHCLRSRGVGPEVRVGICLERSLDVPVAMLAVLKAGAVYVPMDPNYPKERLQFMIADAELRMVLTSRRHSTSLPNGNHQVQYLDLDSISLDDFPQDNPAVMNTPENLANIIYTSGSTGQPKGAGIPHRAVTRLVSNCRWATLNSEQVFLQLSPLTFDASTLEIWGCLLNGAKLVFMPPGVPPLEDLGTVLEKDGITILWLSAGLFHKMVENQIQSLRGVRQLLAGGDVLSPAHVKRVMDECPQCCLINGYGPTENTVFTCCYPAPAAQAHASVPIGRPVSNTRVFILDSLLQPVPIGVPGELYTSGDGLARGYIGRPDLTAEKFLPFPLSSEPGARIYRTGDYARFLADGRVEFLGRRDHQVKVRGYRIELGEIEAVLNQHPAIAQSVVEVRAVDATDKLLVAYVVSRVDQILPVEDLRGFLKQRLPDYMVPQAFLPLDALPLTSHGKVDRAALPGLPFTRPDLQVGFVAARSELEKTIAAVWQDVLEVERVGIRDNFFDLGGHSLRMVQVNSKLRSVLPVPVTLLQLFEYPTIESLAAFLGGREIAPARHKAQDEQIERLKQGKKRLREHSRRQRGTE
jgi:amino acid adenylation domain-containing protein